MMHPATFEYQSPTDEQKKDMADVREAAAEFASVIDVHVPDGPDKTYALRTLRTVAMWCNVAITRQPDGAPRE